MSVYDLHFNKDHSTIRAILVGLLSVLSNSIKWNNQIGTSVEQKKLIEVPFYFSTTGTERYLQDNFLNNIDFDPENLEAEAFYNHIPRGIVNFDSLAVESQSIVNKYVRMNHQFQEDDGTINTYNSETFMVPITMDVTCSVYLDSILDQLKCTENLIKTFYKAKSYQVDTESIRIPCLIVFPDDYQQERTVEFTFTDKKEFKVDFTLQIKSFIPIFKEGTSLFAGTVMGNFQTNVYDSPIGSSNPTPSSNANDGSPSPSGSLVGSKNDLPQDSNTFGPTGGTGGTGNTGGTGTVESYNLDSKDLLNQMIDDKNNWSYQTPYDQQKTKTPWPNSGGSLLPPNG